MAQNCSWILYILLKCRICHKILLSFTTLANCVLLFLDQFSSVFICFLFFLFFLNHLKEITFGFVEFILLFVSLLFPRFLLLILSSPSVDYNCGFVLASSCSSISFHSAFWNCYLEQRRLNAFIFSLFL